VKPIALMRYLCRLVTPPGGVVLDPFLGSGSTGVAAVLEGFRFIGIEQDAESVRTAIARIQHWSRVGPPAPRSHRSTPARAPQSRPTDALVEMLPLFEESA
jgi:DNA modification methylase